MTAFVGHTSDATRRLAERRRLIAQRNRVMQARRKGRPSPERREKLREAARARWAAARDRLGLEPRDRTIEHGGSPDFELDQVPDSLTEDR
jgi:hypothetical protein